MDGIRQICGKELARVFKDGKMLFSVFILPVVIMIVVLFFRRGIMGDRELPDLLSRRRRRRKTGKGGGSNG